MSDLPEWTSAEYLANISADELLHALEGVGIGVVTVGVDRDGDVSVGFRSMADAECLLTLAVPGDDVPGSLADRASSSCVALSALANTGEPVSEDTVRTALGNGWEWMVHPDVNVRRVRWHVSLSLPVRDADLLTAALNSVLKGGA